MIKSTQEMVAHAKSKIKSVSASEARRLFDSEKEAILLDVRETEAADKEKLPKSVNVPRGLIEMKIHDICKDPDTIIFIHCAAGGRACLSALTLTEMGYRNVYAITAKFDEIQSAFS